MIKRTFDLVFSVIGLLVLSPILLLIAFLIKIDSQGPVFFIQERVGKHNKNFSIYKFRTMHIASQNQGLLTLGNHDSRITRVGFFLRRYKIDELPQLINILIGNMSIEITRPDFSYFVYLYNKEDYIVISSKPGLTSFASLKYCNEAELLHTTENPENLYINNILPNKLELDKEYIANQHFLLDIKLIINTVAKIWTTL